MPTHGETRIVPYSPEQLFDLVADIESYPLFLPWCIGARIRRRDGRAIYADLIIGYKMIREQFTSKVTPDRPALRIDVEYTDGPFRYLNNHWRFIEHPDGCLIDFYVDFEFKNRMLRSVMGLFFNEAVRRMVQAFESRATALYEAETRTASLPGGGETSPPAG